MNAKQTALAAHLARTAAKKKSGKRYRYDLAHSDKIGGQAN